MSVLGSIKNKIVKIANSYGVEVRGAGLYYDYNYISSSQAFYFKEIFDFVERLDGDIVECGVGGGFSLLTLCSLVASSRNSRKIYGFDSFEGFPEPSKKDFSTELAVKRNVKKGENFFTIESVKRLLDYNLRPGKVGKFEVGEFIKDNVILEKGFFGDSLSRYSGDKIIILHADVDLYESYFKVFEAMYSRVVDGGAILFDEYGEKKFPGAKKAIDEFFKDKSDDVLFHNEYVNKYFVIKGARALDPKDLGLLNSRNVAVGFD